MMKRVVFGSLFAVALFAASPSVKADEKSQEASAVTSTTLSGTLLATQMDAAKKATAFDIQTADGKVYHVTFDEKTAQTMTTDLGAMVNQDVELTGQISPTDAETLKVTSFKKVSTEKVPN